MASLKDLLVAGPTRLIGRIFVSDSTLVTNLNADMLDGKHASDFSLTSHTHTTLATITRSTNANHFVTFVDSDNSPAAQETFYTSAKIKINPSTGDFQVGGKVMVGTGGTNSYLGSDSASNIYLRNSSGAVLVADGLAVRRGASVASTTLGNSTYPWANLYTKKVTIDSSSVGATAHIEFNRKSWNYIQVPTGGALAISINATGGANTFLTVDETATYPGYHNKTLDLGTSTYQWKNLYAQRGLFSAAQGTAPLAVDSSTQVANFYAEFAQKIQPLYEKTFDAYTCTANNATAGWIYFGNVVPTSSNWPTPYYIYYTLTVDTTVSNCHGEYDCMVGVAGSTITCANFNRFYSTSYYPIYTHALLYHNNATKYANRETNPTKIGVRVQSAYGPDTVARTYTIKVWKLVGCTFSFPDNIEVYSSVYNESNYASSGYVNATSLGLQETGDTDTTVPRNIALYYSYIKSGTNGIKQYSLVMQDSSGNWQSFTTGTGGTGTSKAKNPAAFRLGSRIFYMARSTDVAANTAIGANQLRAYQELVDLRYSLNITLTAGGANNLVPYKPVYIVGTLGSDGYFYLVNSPWWTQTEPTEEDGKIYIRVGEAVYPDYANDRCYRCDLLSDGYAFWYKDGQFQRYFGKSANSISTQNVTLADSGNANATFYPTLAKSTTGDASLYTDAGLTFNASTNQTTLAGDILISKSSPSSPSQVINGLTVDTGNKISFGVGTGGTNRGIYDGTKGAWILYTDGTNVISGFGALVPYTTNYQDLGTNSLRWKSVHVSFGIDSSSTLYLDSAASTSILFRTGTTEVARVSKNLTVDINDAGNTNTTNKLYVKGRTKILNGVLNITGEADYAEGIRIHSVSNISSLWFHATNETGYDAGMIGLTRDNTGLRVRLPDTAAGTSASDRINILYGGNVGIGTTTPKTKFHVSGGQAEFNSSGTGASTITTAVSGLFVGPTSQRAGTAGNYSSGIGFSHMLNYSTSYTNNSVQGWVGLRLTSTSGSELGALVLATKAGTGASDIPAERMCILPTGRIGINEKTPTTLLQITDSSNLSGGRTLFIKNATFNLAAYFYNTLSLYSAMVANSRAINIVGKAESAKNSAYWGYHHTADGSNSNFFTIGVYGVNEILNVFGSGNVAIGSTTNPSNKLDVTGVTNSTSYKVANTATIVYNASTGCLEINT